VSWLRRRDLPCSTLFLLTAIVVKAFVDTGLFILLLLASSELDVSWWVTAVVLANLIPPILLAPVLGWLVDRTSGKVAWVLALIGSALCISGMAITSSPELLVALVAVQAACSVVFSTAVYKLLPDAPGLDDQRASTFLVTIEALAGIGAPPLAALAVDVNTRFAFGLFAILSLAVAAVTGLTSPKGETRVEVERTAWHEVWLGTRTIKTLSTVRVFVPVILGVALVTSMEGVAGVFYLQEVAGSALGYGILMSAWAIGSLVGVALTSRTAFRISTVYGVIVGGLLISAAIFVEGLVPHVVVIGTAFVIGGFGNSVHNMGIRNLVYEQVPTNQRAQVWGLVGASFSVVVALGNVLGTPDILFPARTIIVFAGAAGVAIALGTLIALRSPSRRLLFAEAESSGSNDDAS